MAFSSPEAFVFKDFVVVAAAAAETMCTGSFYVGKERRREHYSTFSPCCPEVVSRWSSLKQICLRIGILYSFRKSVCASGAICTFGSVWIVSRNTATFAVCIIPSTCAWDVKYSLVYRSLDRRTSHTFCSSTERECSASFWVKDIMIYRTWYCFGSFWNTPLMSNNSGQMFQISEKLTPT